jgi:hypothetical protein
MLRGEWAGQKNSPSKTFNGESWITDSKGNIVSCAHRCVALIMAELERQRMVAFGNDEMLEKYGLEVDQEITVPVLLVEGVDPPGADTADTGKGRSLGDVLFRRNEFANGKSISDSVKAKLSRELAVAVRLVWLRLNGGRVARGAKLHHPEAIAFLGDHPLLHDAILFLHEEDGGSGAEGKKITDYLTLGYAAGLMYLMAYSENKRDSYEKGMDMSRKPKSWALAEEFFVTFAQEPWGTKKHEPVKALHKALEKNKSSEDKLSRDALCTLVTRSWLAWTKQTDKWQTGRALTTGLYTKDGDKEVLNFERFGGLDLEREVLVEQGWVTEAVVERTAVDDWKVGDTCWVAQPEVEAWFGEIKEFSADGLTASVYSADDEQEWACQVSWLQNLQPEEEEEEFEEEEEEVAEE